RRRFEIVDRDRAVPVAGAELVRVDAEVVRQLEPVAVTGQAHEDVDRLVANRHPPALLEPERLVERDRPLDIGDPVAGVNELHAPSLPLEILPQQPVEHAVDPVAVPPAGTPPDALAAEADPLRVAHRPLVEAVDLELQAVVVEVEEEV